MITAKRMNRMINAIALLAGLWIADAAAQIVDMAMFERLTEHPFVTVPEGDQASNADWKRYADLVSVELEQRRMKRVTTLDAADYAIFIEYAESERPSMQIVVAEAKPYRNEKKIVKVTRVSVSTGSGFKVVTADLIPGLVEAIFVPP